MINNWFYLFLTAHVLGDFYFQTDTVARKKNTHPHWRWLHFALYTAIAFAAVIPVWSAPAVFCAAAVAASHIIIDLIKVLICKIKPECEEKHACWIYGADQILHVTLILAICAWFYMRFGNPGIVAFVARPVSALGIHPIEILKGLLLVLLICKPVNITFNKLFSHYRPSEVESAEKPEDAQSTAATKAGATIGFLERLIIVVLLGIGEYASIGLILAAKSIVRYSKIAENRAFGEYYLIGTLFSVLSALGLFFLIR
ncbi:MAG: DUF3307 domain-containing protein [Eubacteriales bacterium]|nr:DUF3307 domain-containing protein [Eubacteriales bacterium]